MLSTQQFRELVEPHNDGWMQGLIDSGTGFRKIV